MKRSLFRQMKPIALAAVGVFLGRGACADTTLTFDARPAGQAQNAAILQSFGDNAAASSTGVSVIDPGTPDIGLSWQATGGRWDYYVDAVWSAAQLDSSGVGDLHEIVFSPGPATAAVIKSFNFHPYYDNGLDYSYDWRVLSGTTVLTNGSIAFTSDSTKNHPVNINYQGVLGAALTLQLERTGGTDAGGNIAIDDLVFAQFPLPAGPAVTFLTPGPGETGVAPEIRFAATIKDASTAVDTNSISLTLNGTAVAPTVSKSTNLTTVAYQAAGLLPSGTNKYVLTFRDLAAVPKSYTNADIFAVANYRSISLPPPIVFENFNSTPEGSLPPGWSQTNYTDIQNPLLDLQNLDSASYATWIAVDAARFTNSFISYSDTNQLVDYSLVLSPSPSNVVNGAYVRDLATGRFLIGNSGYRNGRSQVMFLFTPDFNLTGKTNVYLSFHSLWEQNQDSIAAVEYSTNAGQTWLPVVYMLDRPDVLLDANTNIDAAATFSTEAGTAAEAIPFYTDPVDGQDKGGIYGAFIGVAQAQWPTLAPYISPRVNDDDVESKRVELFRLPNADNQPAVRFRFSTAGTDSWYWGIDDFGLYSIPGSSTGPMLSIRRENNEVVVSWPANASGFTLESKPTLTNPAWSAVTGVSNNSVRVVIGPTNQFFRLRQ